MFPQIKRKINYYFLFERMVVRIKEDDENQFGGLDYSQNRLGLLWQPSVPMQRFYSS